MQHDGHKHRGAWTTWRVAVVASACSVSREPAGDTIMVSTAWPTNVLDIVFVLSLGNEAFAQEREGFYPPTTVASIARPRKLVGTDEPQRST